MYGIMHLNIHSLASKLDELRNILVNLQEQDVSIHFILLCETTLTDAGVGMCSLPGYNLVCKNRETGRGGGVVIYIKNRL